MIDALSYTTAKEIRGWMQTAGVLATPTTRSSVANDYSGFSLIASTPHLHLDNRSYNILSSQTINNHAAQNQNSEKSEKDKRSTFILGVVFTVGSVIATFFLGRSLADWQGVSECSKKLSSLKKTSTLCKLQAEYITYIATDLKAIQKNKLWAVCSRVSLAAGLAFIGIGLMGTLSPLVILGTTALIGGALSEALRMGMNWTSEKRRKEAIEFYLNAFEGHKICDSKCISVHPPSYAEVASGSPNRLGVHHLHYHHRADSDDYSSSSSSLADSDEYSSSSSSLSVLLHDNGSADSTKIKHGDTENDPYTPPAPYNPSYQQTN